jgi:valyl-tRNA synthetase
VELPEKVVTPEELEKTRRELEKSRNELAGVEARLANEQFVNNAPPNVVAGAQARRAELLARIEKLEKNA